MTDQPKKKLDADRVIEHADRYWVAERELAARYTTRIRLSVAVVTTLVTLNLAAAATFLKSDLAPAVSSLAFEIKAVVVFVALFPVVASILTLVTALVQVLPGVRLNVEPIESAVEDTDTDASEQYVDSANKTASDYLAIDDSSLNEISEGLEPENKVVFLKTYNAAADLRIRNELEKKQIAISERMIRYGAFWTLVTLMVYITYGYGYVLIGESKSNVCTENCRQQGTSHSSCEESGLQGRGQDAGQEAVDLRWEKAGDSNSSDHTEEGGLIPEPQGAGGG